MLRMNLDMYMYTCMCISKCICTCVQDRNFVYNTMECMQCIHFIMLFHRFTIHMCNVCTSTHIYTCDMWS